jgi:hypothetical protein
MTRRIPQVGDVVVILDLPRSYNGNELIWAYAVDWYLIGEVRRVTSVPSDKYDRPFLVRLAKGCGWWARQWYRADQLAVIGDVR